VERQKRGEQGASSCNILHGGNVGMHSRQWILTLALIVSWANYFRELKLSSCEWRALSKDELVGADAERTGCLWTWTFLISYVDCVYRKPNGEFEWFNYWFRLS
jgi:hypothetical protein